MSVCLRIGHHGSINQSSDDWSFEFVFCCVVLFFFFWFWFSSLTSTSTSLWVWLAGYSKKNLSKTNSEKPPQPAHLIPAVCHFGWIFIYRQCIIYPCVKTLLLPCNIFLIYYRKQALKTWRWALNLPALFFSFLIYKFLLLPFTMVHWHDPRGVLVITDNLRLFHDTLQRSTTDSIQYFSTDEGVDRQNVWKE